MSKQIITTYLFESSSNCNKTYQTLLYLDGSLSCDCPGWTKRVDATGGRSCKHTRLIQAGLGERECKRKVDHRGGARVTVTGPEPEPALNFNSKRKFDLSV